MGRPVSPRTIKIRTALAEHTAIPVIARRYGVTESYVYEIRRKMKKAAAPEEASKPKRVQRARRVAAVPLPAPVVIHAPASPAPPVPPPSLWQRVLAVFKG